MRAICFIIYPLCLVMEGKRRGWTRLHRQHRTDGGFSSSVAELIINFNPFCLLSVPWHSMDARANVCSRNRLAFLMSFVRCTAFVAAPARHPVRPFKRMRPWPTAFSCRFVCANVISRCILGVLIHVIGLVDVCLRCGSAFLPTWPFNAVYQRRCSPSHVCHSSIHRLLPASSCTFPL